MQCTLALLVAVCSLSFSSQVSAQQSKEENPKIERPKRVLVLDARRISTMQKELDQAAAAGYRVVHADVEELEAGIEAGETRGQKGRDTYSRTVTSQEISVPLDEMKVTLVRATQPPDSFQYKVLAAFRASTVEKELNKLGAQGFRLIPEAILEKGHLIGSPELVMLLEKSPTSADLYNYLVVATDRESTLQKEVNQALKDGYTLRRILMFRQRLAFMEKEGEK